MAFGLGFNKAKVLSTAEKFVVQGKIPAAIEEYRKVLDRDKKDLTILNTVADLCVRVGKNDEAVKYFYDLADHCMEAGLVPRAIATYKRITKIDADAVQALLKLGELYSVQGLLRDARGYYSQAVEYHWKRNEKEKARDVFEKLLMLDTENPQLQFRMGELYAATDKKAEAIFSFLSAAGRYLDQHDPGEATGVLRKLLQMDPQNAEALTLLGRSQLEQGDAAAAVKTIEAIPGYDGLPDSVGLLFRAYSKLGNASKVHQIAVQLLEKHGDVTPLSAIGEELIAQGEIDAALEFYGSISDQLIGNRAADTLIDAAKKILDLRHSDAGALELLLKGYQAAGNVGEVRETTEHLAQAYHSMGELERARALYKELVHHERDNPDHVRLLRQVESEMGLAEAPLEDGPESSAAMLADLSNPVIEEESKQEVLSSRDDQLVKSCITEAELFITYHQFSRAIEVIEAGLAQIPGNTTLLDQLLTLCEQSQQYGKAAECCQALAEAYVKLGDGERAARYGESLLNYQQKAQEAGARNAGAEVEEGAPSAVDQGVFDTMALPGGIASPAGGEPEVREVDLSMEWSSAANVDGAVAGTVGADSLVDEIEFYIQAGLSSDAMSALIRLEEQSPGHPSIAGFRKRLGLDSGAGESEGEPAPATTAEEPGATSVFDLAATASPDTETLTPSAPSEPETAPMMDFLTQGASAMEGEAAFQNSPAGAAEAPVAEPRESIPAAALQREAAPTTAEKTPPAEPEFSLDQELAAGAVSGAASGFELSLEDEAPAASAAAAPADPFASLAGDLSGELEGALAGEPPASVKPAPASSTADAGRDAKEQAPTAAGAKAPGPLDDIFAQFKAEMEEVAADEDPETHYNMGVAFKEMALYDEAIGEFQKAQEIAQRTNDHSHVVQYCSLLATCFLEKGLPQLAVKWYQTALDTPGVDPESVPAFLYELGSAQEIAGDRQGALRSFMEVYARNIDYRDVATRIQALQQPQ
jgi:tetratricopeptide (TPR) repeat protein